MTQVLISDSQLIIEDKARDEGAVYVSESQDLTTKSDSELLEIIQSVVDSHGLEIEASMDDLPAG